MRPRNGLPPLPLAQMSRVRCPGPDCGSEFWVPIVALLHDRLVPESGQPAGTNVFMCGLCGLMVARTDRGILPMKRRAPEPPPPPAPKIIVDSG